MTKRRSKPKAQAPRPSTRKRAQDWPTLLFHFIESRRTQPFAWGRQDCCLFACDGILAQTGLDPAAPLFRGQYHDALDAARLVRKHGGVEAIATKVCRLHGWPELLSPRRAQRGDLVLINATDEEGAKLGRAQLGICVGGQAAFPGLAGLVFHPLKACLRAWAIGRAG